MAIAARSLAGVGRREDLAPDDGKNRREHRRRHDRLGGELTSLLNPLEPVEVPAPAF
jgi:hypothetical protein